MPSSPRNKSPEVLLERTIFKVSREIYAEYLARLDVPAQPNDRLKRTMSTKAPWDEPTPQG
ncbi:UNVERIFIED_ORG: uncharacterized protein (DUF1778 family) [Rhizobium esperanzae]|uniref:DUF1778 domain-containing protein n=1 Tax=Rhizobium phaseoli TaxID=396 RepID=A0A192TJ22_9HYPH|nr:MULTISPECIES: DUF1778 domain-containing protein [Rhizobium]MDH6648392.1 uncharacterized protein (DUF1778 family) [Rhizobium esperanzae]ANL43188.1 hypothetical protein AMC88_PB00112 [Rhizobium phaseoli]ANL56187.1 hypothetical protein AMC86_PC00112 [Rhizobium phaseoli]ANL62174.1 hypothetical protein AMC85_PB00112 [Rhizobium phaseoli]ANL87587.1 hypothetical protein AMC81_PC00112 [Rhizobium phaseoli]